MLDKICVLRRSGGTPRPLRQNDKTRRDEGTSEAQRIRYHLVEDLGVDFNSVQCRGSWDGPYMHGETMSFSTETAWYRCTEVEDLIRERYPSIQIYFICEEPGMCIYEKNSSEHFPEDYVIDYEGGDVYYFSEDEALEELSELFGVDFQNMDEALVLVEEHNDDADNENDNIWVHKFETVD